MAVTCPNPARINCCRSMSPILRGDSVLSSSAGRTSAGGTSVTNSRLGVLPNSRNISPLSHRRNCRIQTGHAADWHGCFLRQAFSLLASCCSSLLPRRNRRYRRRRSFLARFTVSKPGNCSRMSCSGHCGFHRCHGATGVASVMIGIYSFWSVLVRCPRRIRGGPLLGHGGSLPVGCSPPLGICAWSFRWVCGQPVWRGVDRSSNLPLCCGRRLMPFADRLGNGQFSTLTTATRAYYN
jgi:hypothetical protein